MFTKTKRMLMELQSSENRVQQNDALRFAEDAQHELDGAAAVMHNLRSAVVRLAVIVNEGFPRAEDEVAEIVGALMNSTACLDGDADHAPRKCPHNEDPAECDSCMIESDFHYGIARERGRV